MNIGIDWLQFSLPEGNLIEETLEELNWYVPSDFQHMPSGMLGYESQLVGAAGCRVLSTPGRPEHHVILPGKWCESVDQVCNTVMLQWIKDRNGKITRLDIAGDDQKKLIRPVELNRIWMDTRQVVTKMRTGPFHSNAISGQGDTQYFGSKKSDRLLRVYDKDVESQGLNDSVRWEIQLRNEMAQRCGDMILHVGINETYLSTLVGIVDFRDRIGANVTRTQRVDWYQTLVNDAKRADYSLPKPVQTIESMAGYINHQAAPTLAALVEARHGELDFLHTMIRDAKERISKSQLMAIGAYRVKALQC